MKMQILLSILLAWLCVGKSIAEEGEPEDLSANKFKVEISGLSVKIDCPTGSTALNKKGKLLSNSGDHTMDKFSTDDNGLYKCGTKFLYLKAYVCESCTEVSIPIVAGILIADCMVTLGVALLVYFGCKRKPARSSEIAPGGRNRGNRDNPPPVPHPDYEPLQKGKQAVYDGLSKNFK